VYTCAQNFQVHKKLLFSINRFKIQDYKNTRDVSMMRLSIPKDWVL